MQVLPADQAPIGKSAALDESFQRAHSLAREQGLGVVTLEHLLFALTDDPEAINVMQSSNVVVDRLRADISGFLGRLNETLPPAGPNGAQPGPDLLRIVQLAGMAARQSPRKLIDGAIVLAAIIGDANSPSAGLLKAHGLTFEEVIRVLQQANLQPRVSQAPPPAQWPPVAPAQQSVAPQTVQPAVAAHPDTTDMLASVRARLKQVEPPMVAVRTPPPAPPSRPVSPPPIKLASLPPKEPPSQSPPTAATIGLEPDTKHVAPPAASHPDTGTPQPSAQSKMRLEQPAVPTMRPIADGDGPSRPPLPGLPPAPTSQLPANQAAAPKPETPASLPPASRPMPPPLPSPQQPQAAQPAPAQSNQPDRTSLPQQVPVLQQATPSRHSQPPPQPQAPPAQFQQPIAPPQATLPFRSTAPLDIMAAASTIPARMQVAHPTLIEISIPRSQLDIIRPNQSRSQPGSNPYNRDPSISRAVSVRLISEPPGALMIASLSPDTIWFDQPASSNDERMTWRFAVSPNTVGRFGLTLATTGRTLGPFGTQIDSNPPTETFEIKTWRPLAPRIGRVFGYVAVFTIGAVAAFLTSDTIKAGFVALSKLLDR